MKFLNIEQRTEGHIVKTENKVLLILKGKQKVEAAKQDITKILDFLFNYPDDIEKNIGVREYTIPIFSTKGVHSSVTPIFLIKKTPILKPPVLKSLVLEISIRGTTVLEYGLLKKLVVMNNLMFAQYFPEIIEALTAWIDDPDVSLPSLKSLINSSYLRIGRS